MPKKLKTIKPAQLPKHFDAKTSEKKWDRRWEKSGIYRFDLQRDGKELFRVDTPPPTVSGSLHVGHVFSYTHTDVVVRYQRMNGKAIYYPMGWDDNGLPTERRVQNYFHVQCDPSMPYEPDLSVRKKSGKTKKSPPRKISRRNFIELCTNLTRKDEEVFKELWKRTGLSVDWREEYSTIDSLSRKTAQYSFIDLYEKGHIYSDDAPTMWDVDFQTAVAQAEIEDREEPALFYTVEFTVMTDGAAGGEAIQIATTRPEFIPACVGIAAHPDDGRYKHLFGKKAATPLFGVPVPIFPTDKADPEKGTGIVMVCTFGDATDVFWWKTVNLALRQVLGTDGRFRSVAFGTEGWESINPSRARKYYQKLEGKTVRQARETIVELLRDPDELDHEKRVPLLGEPQRLTHSVKYYEKGKKPLEFISTRQWFVRLMDKKELLLQKGSEIRWHPSFMHSRFENWTQNLMFDWCISRQRFFGVPFPLWFPLDKEGNPDYENPIIASLDSLPIDPSLDVPSGYTSEQRDKPGGFTAEQDVFDTWFTSSLTPQIGARWIADEERYKDLFPMDIRPQSHEIIRTWAFYTIAKAALHENCVPWKDVLISGWVLDPDRKKMSKSKGNVVTPVEFLDRYSSDAVRYWAASARLGIDTAFEERIIKIGRRLVTKLYNASKFVLSQEGRGYAVSNELDRGFIRKLARLVEQATSYMEKYDFSHALLTVEEFFWQNFTDSYIELAKNRAKGEMDIDKEDRDSAVSTLRIGLSVLLRIFAPFLPFITEEIWSWVFKSETGEASIHASSWPSKKEFDRIEPPVSETSFEAAINCMKALNKRKTEEGLSVGAHVETLTLTVSPADLQDLKLVSQDVMAAARVQNVTLIESMEEVKLDSDDEKFRIADIVFQEN